MYNEELQIHIGGNKIIGLLGNQSMFYYKADVDICYYGLSIGYLNKTETGLDIDEVFALDAQYFLTNYEMHIDYDNKKIYFTGNNVYDNSWPIPDPRIESNAFPIWAIVVLSIVGILALGFIAWYFISKKKKSLEIGLADYAEIKANQ